MNWHLHVTVSPNRNWHIADISSALAVDIRTHNIKPVVLTNVFDDHRRNYKELIPTKHFSGSEAEATRELFHMGVLLNNSGWRVRRLKIEGDPSHRLQQTSVEGGALVRQRAIYYECHVKISPGLVLVARNLHMAISTTAKNTFATVRHPTMGYVYSKASELIATAFQYDGLVRHMEIEAAVLDTAPELDDDWLRAARPLTGATPTQVIVEDQA